MHCVSKQQRYQQQQVERFRNWKDKKDSKETGLWERKKTRTRHRRLNWDRPRNEHRRQSQRRTRKNICWNIYQFLSQIFSMWIINKLRNACHIKCIAVHLIRNVFNSVVDAASGAYKRTHTHEHLSELFITTINALKTIIIHKGMSYVVGKNI